MNQRCESEKWAPIDETANKPTRPLNWRIPRYLIRQRAEEKREEEQDIVTLELKLKLDVLFFCSSFFSRFEDREGLTPPPTNQETAELGKPDPRIFIIPFRVAIAGIGRNFTAI